MWLTVGTIAFFGGTTNQKCSTIPKPRGKKPNAARWCAESATACFEVMRLANEVIDDALFPRRYLNKRTSVVTELHGCFSAEAPKF